MGGANSKEEFKKQLEHIIKEEEKKEKEEESRSTLLIDLTSDQQIPKDSKKIVEERSILIVVSDSETQLKTLCFQPNSSKLDQMQGVSSYNFEPNPTREKNYQKIRNFEKEIRTRFENTSVFPYSVHGIVRANVGKENYITGSGILIGSNLVLTAAHNIYDCNGTKEKYSKIEFIPGINEQEIPFGIFEVVESYVPDDFLKTWEKEDYALLVLSGTAGARTGYFGLNIAEKEFLKGKELNIIGYPWHVRTQDEKNELKYLSEEGSYQLWGMKGKPDRWFFEDGENEFFVNYPDILTTVGQSGSGVYYEIENEGKPEYYVIGIHILGRKELDSYNSAIWITKERFDQIKQWISQSRRNLINQKIAYESRGGDLWIKKLDLSKLQIKDGDLESLSSYKMPKIEFLDLSRNDISDKGVRTLSQKTYWPNLRHLNLSANNITEQGTVTLGKKECWKDLITLDLSENNIGGLGARILSKKSWTNLKTLNLSSNSIGSEGATALSQNESWINLTTLNLERNSIGAEGARALSQYKSWTNLKTLNLSENEIDVKGAIALSQNKSWKKLTILNLSLNSIGDQGVRALSQNKSWTNLTTLNLSLNPIGDLGAIYLCESDSWSNLATLELTLNNITAKGMKVLKQRWPNIELNSQN